ncbi:EAL domain-containing protein [Asticcacaulis sp. EMRT-3]|uniref:EAL domain-containing protein n=1 Tax=Asticcacaulis sp. EMRT-3 TaxID=3040349 RepID=UPI0024AFEE49|nr:EAL domain-containing protein [Asticcacaulis sp. EMRT-3]MDI7773905.1 EAL domain-containing protein [Asticcacaulis sp. EMRT-3]
MKTAADVLASSASDAVAAHDPHDAFTALRAVRRTPGIVYARIEDASGALLSETGAGARLKSDVIADADHGPPGLMALIMTRSIEVRAPVLAADHRIGEVVVVHRSTGFIRDLLTALGGVFAMATAALVIALMIARNMQRALTRPLAELAMSVDAITADHNYSRRVIRHSDDEVGRLVTGFNAMLDAIQTRDARLEAHMMGLESEVAARTRDFMAARDEAMRANAAKSEFLATMSHEIRTPMNGVMVMAELLAAESLPARARRFADTIARSGRNLLAVINDILDFSKIEAGKLEIETCAVALPDLIDDVVTLFAARARAKGLELVAFIDNAAPATVPADPVRLGQIISNLVSNALKFTESGHVLVQAAPDRKAGFWRLTVADTGIGIAADKLTSIFSAFTQEDQTTTRRFGGTGLGLSIAKRLVDAMGGAIAVTSEQGKGTVFHVRLPMTPGTAAAAPPPCHLRARLHLSGALLREALTRRLQAADMILTEGEADLIFTDTMPQEVQTGQIVLIAEADDQTPEHLLAQGDISAVLIRPIRHGELDQLLKRAASGDALTAPSAGSHAGVVTSYPQARVLVVDDGEVNREVALEALSRFGIAARTARDGREALDLIEASVFDLVLMDGSMPVLDGFAATSELRDNERTNAKARLPVVALTAHVVGPAAEAWREAGMDDVLHKPFRLADLERILHAHLPASLREANRLEADDSSVMPVIGDIDELFDMTLIRPMIDGLNKDRGAFVQRVIGLYKQHGPVALDQLRNAHREGDGERTAMAAHALKSMSLNLGAKAVAALADDIERAIRSDARWVGIDEITLLEARLQRTLAELDELLGQALETPSATLASDPEKEMLAALEADLDAGKLEMWYQPIFDRTGTKIVSAEALMRWNRGALPPVGPDIFITLAEKTDLVYRIGTFARRRVMQDARQWSDIPVAVNVSAKELGQVDFTEQVRKTLTETGFDPARLVLEVTETAFMGEPERIRELFKDLHGLGLKLALDDFGVGYSSLTSLHRFAFDKIKIDREFVAALDGERHSALEALAIIQAVTGIGRAFGMTVVAEGIETESQHRYLKACGVHALQGYLFGRPMPASAFTDLISGSLLDRLPAE